VLAFLEDTNRALAAHLAEADPRRVSGADAAKVFAAVAEMERLVGALRVLFTKRAADSMTWRDQGHRSAATWMADKTKSAVGDAVATLEVAGALETLPGTTEALRRGELSAPQESERQCH